MSKKRSCKRIEWKRGKASKKSPVEERAIIWIERIALLKASLCVKPVRMD